MSQNKLVFQLEFIPAKKKVRKDPKLMIVLHGRGDSLKSFLTFSDELEMDEMNYLLLNAPRAYDTGFTWYAFPPHQKMGILDARRRLFQLLNDLEQSGWKSENIFLLGFSQGSLICCDFAQRYPLKLGGVICISGYVYFFKKWKKEVNPRAFEQNWLMTHGFRDDALDINETRKDVQKLLDAGLPIEWVEFDKDHEIDQDYETGYIKRWVRKTYKKT